MELNLCWWNMGLSPPIRSSKQIDIEDIGLAKQYLRKIIKERTLDIVALCEISKRENIDFKQLACELNMEYVDLSGKIGRILIDISIMYNMNKLAFISSKFLTKLQPDNRTIRVGVSVSFKDLENQKMITFFLSHWPSVLSADEKTRRIAAQELRNSIDKLFENKGKDTQIICMGDYNTEPYSDVMINTLYATRDYHIIKKKRELLFNPFWYLLSDKKTNNLGTYYYNSASINRWYVFDQMIFSSSFLYGKEGCFKLDLEQLDFYRILNDANHCLDDIFFKKFDHYPIFCRVSHER